MATGIQTGMNRGSRSGISRNSGLGKGAPGGGGPLDKVKAMWANAGKTAKLIVAVAVFGLILGGGFIAKYNSDNAPVKLYPAKMTDSDIREVSTALTALRIEHKIDLVDGIMLHPNDRLAAQAKLAEMNLPRRPVLTHDQVEGSMGKTAAEQKAIRQQLLEGDITLALRQMEGVNDAMIKLAVPDKTYFQDDTKQVTARVFLSLAPGAELDRGKISGMMNLVAASVPELKAENVTIIDSKGRDLSAMVPRDGDTGVVASGTQLETQAKEELRLKQKAQQALDEAFPGKTKVSVNLEMDFSKVEKEDFTPGGAGDDRVVVESRQITREKLNKGDKSSSSEGELMNGGARPKDGSDYVNEKEAVNYMVGQTKTKRVDTGFRIKRLTASILADNVSEKEKAAIAGFVRGAIGIEESRGDTITVHSVPFQKQMFAGDNPFNNQLLPPNQQQGQGALISGQHLAAAVGVGALMLLGLVGMFLFKQHRVQADQGTIISSAPNAMGSNMTTTITDHFTEKSGKTTAPVSSAGATQVNTTEELEKLVKQRPTKVAEMLKSTWLSQQ